jgi:hypothetical protein
MAGTPGAVAATEAPGAGTAGGADPGLGA